MNQNEMGRYLQGTCQRLMDVLVRRKDELINLNCPAGAKLLSDFEIHIENLNAHANFLTKTPQKEQHHDTSNP